MSPLVRAATADDVPAIAQIYGYAVRDTITTFDTADPPLTYWHDKVSSEQPGVQLLVAELGGTVVGYAASSSFRPRPAYAHTRETSVYLSPDAVGQGLGRLIYSELLARLSLDKVHNVVAVVAEPNPASVALHESLGFELVGVLHEVGRKFDRWIDTRWYQLRLGQGADLPADVDGASQQRSP